MRKPRDFRVDGEMAAACSVAGEDRYVKTAYFWVTGANAKRLAKWLERAAKWAAEKPKKGRRK